MARAATQAIQIGDKTQIHDQSMTFPSFSPMNSTVSSVGKLGAEMT